MDTTTEFLTAFFQQKFTSFEEFHSQLREFEKLTGTIYVITSSKFLPHNHPDRGRLVYNSLTYTCYHHGVCQDIPTSKRTPRTSRGTCSSRISLSAMNSKLYIAKYHMVHNHSQLPEDIVIDQRIRRLQVQQAGKDDLMISDDVQGVLDDIVDHPSKFDTSADSTEGRFPRNASERKAAAKDRLAARTKKARGVKIAPYLRCIAEIATTDSVPDFHKHLGELEALVEIWKQGGVSPLASISSNTVRSNESYVTPNQRITIAKAVENIIRKQNPLSSDHGTPKTAQVITPVGGNTISILPSANPQPVILKQALGAGGQTPNQIVTLPKDVMLADAGNGQLQLISTSGQKGNNGMIEGQPLVGYVLQPIQNTTALQNTVTSNYVPIAPKLPEHQQAQRSFQSLPPPPPKAIRPQMPVCKPKAKRQSKVRPGFSSLNPSEPLVAKFEDNSGEQKPWTPMIVDGDSCPYFLFVEDVNYCYSPEEDAWIPLEQRTMAVDA
ncbi:unnamed protein product [Hymenolepis diminuta]|uniref:SWIM-type domain-containing protein n=2 Tax=Hymenolepis diminuta TaxID=6216 RepID=A0A0R3S9J0_HYMDI|nr:unnamed protein product [Hymenolepis diminuta]